MKKVCPKCGTVLYKSGAQDEKGEHLGTYPGIHWDHDEEGYFVPCRNKDCSEKFRVVFTTNKGVGAYRLLGLVEQQDTRDDINNWVERFIGWPMVPVFLIFIAIFVFYGWSQSWGMFLGGAAAGIMAMGIFGRGFLRRPSFYEYNKQLEASKQIENLPSMPDYIKQLEAFAQIEKLPFTPDYNKNILLKAIKKWGKDYKMVMYEYNKQLEAYKKMR